VVVKKHRPRNIRNTIKFTRLTPEYIKHSYPVLWETAAAALPVLNKDELAIALSLTLNVCRNCFKNAQPCLCWTE
jgi:hypothetical protein